MGKFDPNFLQLKRASQNKIKSEFLANSVAEIQWREL